MHVQDLLYAIIIVHNDTNTTHRVIHLPTAAAVTGSLVVPSLDLVISPVLAVAVGKIVEAVGVSWLYP
jgi:hypothetical protein